MNGMRDLSALIGRILIALIFIMSGWSKITGFASTGGYMASAGIPAALVTPGLIASILVELGCGLLIVLGFKARWAALIIFLWLIPVTTIFHLMPMRAGQNAMINMVMVMKNLSIMGGLLILVGMGPGAYSLDGADLTTRNERLTGREALA